MWYEMLDSISKDIWNFKAKVMAKYPDEYI